MTQLNTLSFNNIPLEIMNDNSGLWIKALSVCECLGYTQPSTSLNMIFNRNADEFTPSMTKITKIKSDSGVQATRVFSLRGVHLFAMLAKTPKAKEFRKWVLDVLENHIDGQKPITAPEEQPLIEKRLVSQEDVTKELKDAYNHLLPVMDNLKAYTDLWKTRSTLLHSNPRQAFALDTVIGELYSGLQDDIQSAYSAIQTIMNGKQPKLQHGAEPSIQRFLERISKRMKK